MIILYNMINFLNGEGMDTSVRLCHILITNLCYDEDDGNECAAINATNA